MGFVVGENIVYLARIGLTAARSSRGKHERAYRSYLAHKKTPHSRTLQYDCLGPYASPRGRDRFLLSEVPLYEGDALRAL